MATRIPGIVAVLAALVLLPRPSAAGDDSAAASAVPALSGTGTATTTTIIGGTVTSVRESPPQEGGVVVDPTPRNAAEQERVRAQDNLANGTVEQPAPQITGTVQTTVAADGIFSIKKSPQDNSCIQIGTVERPPPDCGGPPQ